MKGIGGFRDMGRLLKQAQGQMKDMQRQMAELDERLKERVIEGSAGGGMVKVVMNGVQEALDVRIDPTVVEEGDVEFLQEMVLAAVRQAVTQSREMAEEEKQKIAGSLHVPGLEGLL